MVIYDQPALGSPSDNARIQNRTFTSRLADEVSRRIEREEITSMSFAEVVDGIRRTSQPDRLPQYGQGVCRAGIRIPTPTQAKLPPRLRPVVPSENASQHHHRVASSEPSFGSTLTIPSKVMAIFEVQLEGTNAESPKVLKLVQWLHSLNPNVGLQLSGVYMSRSTEIIFVAPWHLWAH